MYFQTNSKMHLLTLTLIRLSWTRPICKWPTTLWLFKYKSEILEKSGYWGSWVSNPVNKFTSSCLSLRRLPNMQFTYDLYIHLLSCSGNIVEFTMWDELARHFDKKEIEKLAPPIIIAVSSCRVTKYKGMFSHWVYNAAISIYNNNGFIYEHRCTIVSYSGNPLLHQPTNTISSPCLHVVSKIQAQKIQHLSIFIFFMTYTF